MLKQPDYHKKPASEQYLASIFDSCYALSHLNALDDIEKITEEIMEIQVDLSGLLEAYKKEHRTAVSVPPEPVLHFSSCPTITPNAELFRLLSSNASNPDAYLSLTTYLPRFNIFSITLVNRFHRTNALAILASNLVYDFGDDIKLINKLHTPATCHYMRRVRVTFVEGYMQLAFLQQLASGSVSLLPSLRELFVELWPRNPTREDTEDRSWGVQTPILLEALRVFNARVVVEFRWKSDCQRFEREYVGVSGWKRKVDVEAEEVVDVTEAEGMCRRSYELKRR